MLPSLTAPGRKAMPGRGGPRPPRGGPPRGGRSAKGTAEAASSVARFHQAALLTLQADEGKARLESADAEGAEFAAVSQQVTIAILGRRTAKAEVSLFHLTSVADVTEQSSAKTETTMISVCSELRALSARMSNMMDSRSPLEGTGSGPGSAEARASVAERTVRDLTLSVEQLKGDNDRLQSTLRHGVEVGAARHEEIRDAIREELSRGRLDYAAMRKEMHDRIEKAVMAFHLPKFEGALHSLREANERQLRSVEEHKQRLHFAIDGVGAADATADAKTMHSQLPAAYRSELRRCSMEQLLNMIDVLSWEHGVPAVVGRVLHATAPNRTQQVFS